MGIVDTVDSYFSRFSPQQDTGNSRIRALCAPERGKTIALADDELTTWAPPENEQDDFDSMASLLRGACRTLRSWTRELYVLISFFDEVRQLMGDDIVAERTKMLSEIDGLDQGTRDRIRPVIVDSAASIFKTYSLGLAIRKLLKANPLPAIMGMILATAILSAPFLHALTAFDQLHTDRNIAISLTVMLVGLMLVYLLGSWGILIRGLRVFILGVAAMVVLSGPRMSWITPTWLHRFLAVSFPAVHKMPARFHTSYPVWLGLAYLLSIVIAVVLIRALVDYLRGPSLIVLDPRRRGLSGGLLHALLDVAYQAHLMSEDRKLANSRPARRNLYNLLMLAARIASKEWADAQRCGSRQIDRIVRDQGQAIAAEIKKWERKTALAGAELPQIRAAFVRYMVYAADSDWEALAGDLAASRAGRFQKLARRILTLVIPLGGAAGIFLWVHPLPLALVPGLSFLVGLGMSRLLRWLDLGDDVDHGLAISQLLRMPK